MLANLSGSIVIGQTESNAIVLGENHAPVAIVTGSNITSGSLTFLVSSDGTTFAPLYDSTSTEVSLANTSGSARHSHLDITNFYSVTAVKVQEGTSGSPVAQTLANSTFTLVTRNI